MTEKSKITFSPLVIGSLVGILIFSIGLIVASMRYQILMQYQDEEIEEVLTLIENNIENTIQESYSVALTLALTVSKDGEVNNFETVAKQILENNDNVDVLELVPNGVIEYVYPLEGNESVIGYDILNDPAVRNEVLKTAEGGNIYFAGPIELKQGGKAVIGRLPIIINDELWGFSAVLVYLETLIEKSGINNFPSDKYYFQISKTNPNTNEEEYFLPVNDEVSVKTFQSVKFPEGDWRLYGAKLDDSLADTSFLGILIISLFVAFLCGFVTTRLMRAPKELEEMLKFKSRELFSSKETFRKNSELLQSILESPRGIMIFSLDADLNYLAFTTSHKTLMKDLWDVEIEVGKNIFSYITDEGLSKSLEYDCKKALNGEYFDYVRKYGNDNVSEQYWESRFSPITAKDDSVVGLTVYVTNITQRVKAEQEINLEKKLSDSIINNLPGAFYLYNKEGKFYRWNENFEKVTGYSTEEMKVAHPLNFFEGEEKELLTEKIGNVFVVGEDSVEANFMSKDGSKTPYYFTGTAIDYKGEECLLGVGIDISEQKKIEKEITFEKHLSDAVINSLPGTFYLFNKEGQFLKWNENFEKVSNYTAEEIETAHPLDFFPDEERELLKEKIGNVFINGLDSVEAHLLTKDGDKIPFYFTGASMNYRGEECLLGVGIDISEKKKVEKKHEKVLQKLQSHLHNSPLGVVEYDSDLHVISWSKRCEEIFGWSEEEVLNKHAFELIYEQDIEKTEVIARELSSGSVDSNISNNKNYTKSGKIIDCLWYNSVVKDSSGDIVTIMSLVEDITEKKKTEEIIENSLKEKTTLLSEIHHRVKNNLAIVSGLLQLQMNEVQDEKVTRAFEQSINRIISIAMVHELMYKSPDLSSININSYLEMLIPAISTSLSDASSKINFNIDIEEIKLNITEAIPIGLLLNELITNSFKYAFNENNEGSITIKLSEKENSITILYEDDGKGFENNIDFNTPKNLGLSLVHTQLQQLEADYEVDTNSKFRLEFTFPISTINSEH